MKANIFDEVATILRHAAAVAVIPRFETLRPGDSKWKSPDELVTVADSDAEVIIAEGLRALLPDARFVGEEVCAADPSLLDHLGEGAVWVVDPIDGTANFAAGRRPFAMMVALLKNGETVGSWILDPLSNRLAVAERGSGAWIDGERIAISTARPALTDLRGIISTAFRPPERRASVERLQASVAEVTPTARCAGHEYPLVAMRARDFALYWRTLVWDHAPGALLLSEAGGSVTYLDGSAYRPTQSRTGLLLAQNAHVSALLLGQLQSSR